MVKLTVFLSGTSNWDMPLNFPVLANTKVTLEAQKLKKKNNKSKILHEWDKRHFSSSWLLYRSAHLSRGYFFVHSIMKLLYCRCMSTFTWSITHVELEYDSVPTMPYMDTTANTTMNVPRTNLYYLTPWQQITHWRDMSIYCIFLPFYKYSALKRHLPAYGNILLQGSYAFPHRNTAC